MQQLSGPHFQGKRAAKQLVSVKKYKKIVLWILENKGWQEQYYLLQAISANKDRAFLNHLLHNLQNRSAKMVISRALAKLQATYCLKAAMGSKDPSIRMFALMALPQLKKALVLLPQVFIATRDKEKFVKAAAISAAVKIAPKHPKTFTQLCYLFNTTPDIRLSIAPLFAHMGKKATDFLVQALKTSDNKLKGLLIVALGETKNSSALVADVLLKFLQDKNVKLKKEAIISLGKITLLRQDIVTSLLKLLKDPIEHIRRESVISLSRLAPDDIKVVKGIIPLCQDVSPYVREKAVKALLLSKIRTNNILKLMLTLTLSDPSSVVRTQAALSLRKFGQKPIKMLLPFLQDEEKQLYAAIALGKMGPKATVWLLPLLREQDDQLRKFAAIALGKIGHKATPKLIELIKTENLRWQAAHALSSVGEKAILSLKKLSHHSDSSIREATAAALGGIRNPQIVPILKNLLKDPHEDVRAKAAYACFRVDVIAKSASRELLLALKDKHWQVRANAAWAMSEMGVYCFPYPKNRVVTPLIKLFEDFDPVVRQMAIRALGVLDNSSSKATLVLAKALKDKELNVVLEAITALGRSKNRMAIDILKAQSQNKNMIIKRRVLETLLKK